MLQSVCRAQNLYISISNKRKWQRMILNYVKVIDSENTNVIDCKFSFEDNQDSFNNHNTLILGENGVGKSFILRLVTDIFMNIDKARKQKRKPKSL